MGKRPSPTTRGFGQSESPRMLERRPRKRVRHPSSKSSARGSPSEGWRAGGPGAGRSASDDELLPDRGKEVKRLGRVVAPVAVCALDEAGCHGGDRFGDGSSFVAVDAG